MKKPVLLLIYLYKTAVSPFLPQCCRFYPSCSDYAHEAVSRHGLLKGAFLSIYRLLRCQPLNPGGYDPVDATEIHPHIPFIRRPGKAS